MDDSVLMDLADIADNTYYQDKFCKEIETILAKDSRFEGCRVKRLRLHESAPELKDPFDILTSEGKHVVWFYEWELEILGDSEIPSYLEVQKKREQNLDAHISWDLSSWVVMFIGFVAFLVDVGLMFLDLATQTAFIFFPITMSVLLFGLVLNFMSKTRRRVSEKKLDIDSAKGDPLFLRALRKLSVLSESGIKELEEYSERLEKVEKAILIE
jgi:hypothetical protein